MPEASKTAVGPDLKVTVERLLTDILGMMEHPARFDFQDASDGALGVAVHFTGELPAGVAAGKRSQLVDSLQFLVNKAVNRPPLERRWVNLGVGGFPEPRTNRPAPSTPGSPPSAPRAQPAAPMSSAPRAPNKAPPPARAPVPPRNGGVSNGPSREPDERALTPEPDAAVTALGQALAAKSAAKGRTYAVMLASAEDRARLLKAASGVAGSSTRVDGEGYFRRVVFVPEKPTPMPRKNALMVEDDEDEA